MALPWPGYQTTVWCGVSWSSMAGLQINGSDDVISRAYVGSSREQQATASRKQGRVASSTWHAGRDSDCDGVCDDNSGGGGSSGGVGGGGGGSDSDNSGR